MNAAELSAEADTNPTTASFDPSGKSSVGEFDSLVRRPLLNWTIDPRLIRRQGAWGQGAACPAEKTGTDVLKVLVALKFFSSEP
jgi:hypothetical protein